MSFDTWENELYHHGIRGQKWGVRHFQNEDGSLTTAGRQHYGYGNSLTKAGQRAYNRELRKLNKYADRANVDLQRQKALKYDKRAKTAGKVALATGAAAIGGHFGINKLGSIFSKQIHGQYENLKNLDSSMLRDIDSNWRTMLKSDKDAAYEYAKKAIEDWYSKFNTASSAVKDFAQKRKNIVNALDITKKVMAGAAAVSAGFAAYNKIQSHLSKKRMTEVGHAEAVKKLKAQQEKMMNMFGDVKISEIMKSKKSQTSKE